MEKTYLAYGGADKEIDNRELEELFSGALSRALCDINNSGQVIIIPPDITRFHSRAGFLTEVASKQLADLLGAVLPATGTHVHMNETELSRMFGKTPREKFVNHKWRENITELGRLETNWVEKTTEGKVNYDIPIQVNKLLCQDNPDNRNFSLAISVGQVVPHEVAGMANHSKNIFIGTGGKETIDKSHFAGAVYGMEKIIGRTNTPVRVFFDEGMRRFCSKMPPILWVLTVIGNKIDGSSVVRGLYIGFGRECFEKASVLAGKINVNRMSEPVNKIIVNLNPDEYKSTWLGNKAIYRTRLCISDGGELIIIAPGLERFGEDKEVDSLIKKYGYRRREEIISVTKKETELCDNLCVAAHLIHGSSEGKFKIRYCPGNKMSRKEIEAVGYEWGEIGETCSRYDINKLTSGWNTLADGEKIFYIHNPSLGLWVNSF